MEEFEYAAEIHGATTEKLRSVLSDIARARSEWLDAEHSPESDVTYIDAVGVSLRALDKEKLWLTD